MKFVQRWIAKRLKWYWENADRLIHGYQEDRDTGLVYVGANSSKPPIPMATVSSRESPLRGNAIDLKIYTANGGYVLEFYRYDNIKDRSVIETYVIDDNVDRLGESISQIVVQYAIQNR